MPKHKHKPGPSTSKYKYYTVESDTLKRIGRICPKCGPAIFMATHANRYHCGRCGYTEIKK
ncbi:MAG: 30S ribosomal protein S27ae [Candidatus Nanoarchaeia archaeon]